MRKATKAGIRVCLTAKYKAAMCFAFSAFLLAAPLAAQKGRWKDLNGRASKLDHEGKIEEATAAAEESLRVAETTFGPQHENTATSLNNLAELYRKRGRDAEAEPLYQRAIAIYEKALGPEHKNVAISAGNLARLYWSEGKYAQAEPLYQRAIRINERVLGSTSPEVATLLGNLGMTYYLQAKYPEAVLVYQRALDIYQKSSKRLDVANTLDNLGALYDLEGKFADAEQTLQRALAIREEVLGPEHLNVADSLSRLGINYLWYEHKPTEAEPFLRRALSIREKALGPEHLDVAESLSDLGTLYSVEGKFAQAEPLIQRALHIREKILGPENPSLAQSLIDAAEAYKQEGKYAEAEPFLLRALSIREKALRPEHPDVAEPLGELGTLYSLEGKLAEAEPLLQRALRIREGILGPEGPYLARSLIDSLNKLAAVFTEEGKYAEAEQLYQRALSRWGTTSYSQGAGLVDTFSGLGTVYVEEGKYAEAEPLLQRALSSNEKTLGPEHPAVASSLDSLALLYFAQAKPDRAEALYARAFNILFHRFQYQFSYMSEKERLGFLATVGRRFPVYFSFVERFQKSKPELAGEMYDLLLWQKGFIAASETTLRRQVAASGDTEALKLLNQLAAKRTQFAALVNATPAERAAWRKQMGRSEELPGELGKVLGPPASLPPEPEDGNAWRKQIEQVEAEANELEKELVARSAVFAQQKNVDRVTWRQVREALRPGEAAIEFTRFDFYDGMKKTGKSLYTALVVTSETRDHPAYVSLGEGKDLEGAPWLEFQKELQTRGMKLVTPATTQTIQPGAKTYELFWKPLEVLLAGKTRVYVSPDGILNQIPIGLMPTPDGKPLMEEYDLRLVSSTKELLWPATPTAGNTAVVIGNPRFSLTEEQQRAAVAEIGRPAEKLEAEMMQETPMRSPGPPSRELRPRNANVRGECNLPPGGVLCPLPGTAAEVAAVSELLRKQNWQVALYREAGAVEEALKAAQRPRLVHIATHGFFLSDQRIESQGRFGEQAPRGLQDPMLRSGLLFAGADRALKQEPPLEGVENGVLTAFEATTLNLQGTELVVLSACETGLGEAQAGEGVFGLRRALQEAGAGAVLMSLWSVPDEETKELMELFYAHWLNGEEKHAALRAAELQERERVKERYGRDLPYYWAAFVLVGR